MAENDLNDKREKIILRTKFEQIFKVRWNRLPYTTLVNRMACVKLGEVIADFLAN